MTGFQSPVSGFLFSILICRTGDEQFISRLSARVVGATRDGREFREDGATEPSAARTRHWRANVGAVIMLGTLFGLIVLIFGLVLRYDPEARGPSKPEDGDA